MRYLRFKYPTYMFETPSFEINEEGTPFWIVPIMDKTIGLFGGIDIIGAVAVDAITGETNVISTNLEGKTKLNTTQFVTDKNWQWIDRIYSANILNAQYNYYGQLSGGFINSIIGQEGVKVTSQGYNYLALNDDVYMYTGVTSISSDQSIIGFVLLNQRTKETRFYQISGALEGTAQTSAQGAVQQYKYEATFPLLLNIS
ncbi:MAG: CvpA family protein, partial [Oscillospiraceae bacterium]